MVSIKKDIKSVTQPNAKVDDYYNEAVWPVLAVAQIFAIMPVSNLRHENHKFKWFTVSVAFSLCYIVVAWLLAYLQGRQIFNGKVNTSNSGGIIFYLSIILTFHLFFIMARKWNKLIESWREKEEIFLYRPYKRNGWNLRWKIRLVAALFLNLAIIEHGISLVRNVANYNSKVEQCKDGLIQDKWRHFFKTEYFHVFSQFQFNALLAVFIVVIACHYIITDICLNTFHSCTKWMNALMSIAWNYSDIFIIMVSLALSTRFKQLSYRISTLNYKDIDQSIWSEIRQHYVLLCELLEIVDKNLATLILLSCANNLYFICYQLLNIFDELPNLLSYVYFWYSLLLLIGRTIVMFLCSSEIHDASQKPLEVVRTIPSEMWCSEVIFARGKPLGNLERFSDQLTNETVALSGMKFFFITRKLVLCMVGTIITYELVLLQFDSQLDPETIKKDLKQFCNIK